MKSTALSTAGILLIAAAVLIASSAFTVQESQYALVFEFGKHLRTVDAPGLFWKTPFIQNVVYFEKRVLEWDGDATQLPTRDKKFIWLDATARWRITDPLLFYKRLKNELMAQTRLDDIIDNATKDAVSDWNLIETIRNDGDRKLEFLEDAVVSVESQEKVSKGRGDLREKIIEIARRGVDGWGVEIIDVQVKRINYNAVVQQSVFARMISERQRIAKRIRSEGEGERQKILGTLDRDLRTIQSEAYNEATQIRGRADAKAVHIYAESYSRDPEFYSFLRTLETYKSTIDAATTLILSTDNEYLSYLKGGRP